MAALNFPANPSTGDMVTLTNGVTYNWTGTHWASVLIPAVSEPYRTERHHKIWGGAVEEEIALPTWCKKIEFSVSQALSAPTFPFEIRIKNGTGNDYGTTGSNYAVTSWTNNAGVGLNSGQAPYWRIFLPYFNDGSFYLSRGTGQIYIGPAGDLIQTNITGSINGVTDRESAIGANPTTFSASGYGNLAARPTVLGLSCPISNGLQCSVIVYFYA